MTSFGFYTTSRTVHTLHPLVHRHPSRTRIARATPLTTPTPPTPTGIRGMPKVGRLVSRYSRDSPDVPQTFNAKVNGGAYSTRRPETPISIFTRNSTPPHSTCRVADDRDQWFLRAVRVGMEMGPTSRNRPSVAFAALPLTETVLLADEYRVGIILHCYWVAFVEIIFHC